MAPAASSGGWLQGTPDERGWLLLQPVTLLTKRGGNGSSSLRHRVSMRVLCSHAAPFSTLNDARQRFNPVQTAQGIHRRLPKACRNPEPTTMPQCLPPAAAVLRAALLCMLLCFTTPAHSTAVLPGDCVTLTHNFGAVDFTYTAAFSSSDNLPADCTFQLSSLYMKGTCSTERNNEGTGCSNGISGSEVNANSCEAVFADAPSNALHTPSIPGTQETFDSGSLCNTYYSTGYFFATYNCTSEPLAGPTPLQFNVDIAWNGNGSCSGTSWSRYLIAVVFTFIAVGLFSFVFLQCARRRRRAAQPAVVQLAPPSGGSQAGGGGYYSGSAAYGADVPPSYAGAWGGAQGGYSAPAGYPPGGAGGPGYGPSGFVPQPQPYFPPPMSTVTLGQPVEDSSGGPEAGIPLPSAAGSGGLYRPPGGVQAAGNGGGDSQAKCTAPSESHVPVSAAYLAPLQLRAACLLLLLHPVTLADGWSSVTSAAILAGQCIPLTHVFGTMNFIYTATFGSSGNMAPGCVLRLSSLYMQGTCSSERNNKKRGCSSGTGSEVGPSFCKTVFADAPSDALHTPAVPTTSFFRFDAGTIEGAAYKVGYVFAAYNCTNATAAGEASTALEFDVVVTMDALVQSLRAQAKAMGSFQPAPAPLEPWERQLSEAVSGQTSLGSFPCEADAARAVDAGLLTRDGLAAAPMLAFPLATYAASLSPQLFLEALQQGLLQLPAAAAHPQPTDQPPAAYAPIAGTTAAECCMLPPVPQPVARKASMTPRVSQQG
ncbi:hypothetical protein ACK3TF_005016 [Chlorella vulgaris]